jgi:hypothetical protein
MVGRLAASLLPVKTRWHRTTADNDHPASTQMTQIHANLKADDQD